MVAYIPLMISVLLVMFLQPAAKTSSFHCGEIRLVGLFLIGILITLTQGIDLHHVWVS